MGDAKIEIKVGAVSFSGEGEATWVSEQLDKLLKKIPELVKVAPAQAESANNTSDQSSASGSQLKAGTLASFLKGKQATGNKTKKFLATAVWLERGGKSPLTTTAVTTALSDAKQGGLGNASQCLASNVTQGFCHKQGKKEFYVTDEGRAEIGE